MNSLVEALRKITAQDANVVWGEVLSVNETDERCIVDHESLEYKCLLSINASGQVEIPEPHSKVLIGFIANTPTAFVIRTEQVAKLKIRVGEASLIIEKSGFSIASQGENLLSVLTDLIDEVAKIIVVQGTSPNVPALTSIKERTAKILKDVK